MASYCTFRTSDALVRHLRQYADLPRSREFARFRQEVRGAVDRGYREGVLAGTDGRGRPMPALESPRKGAYAGATGKPLTPFGKDSRFYSAYRSKWVDSGSGWVLVGYLEDTARTRAAGGKLRSRRWENLKRRVRGRARVARFSDIAFYHLTGAGHNPRRDPSGIRPRTWAEIRTFLSDFKASLARRGA